MPLTPTFKKGDVLRASDLSWIVEHVLRALKVTAAAPLEIVNSASGNHIRLAQPLVEVAIGETNEEIAADSTGGVSLNIVSDPDTPTYEASGTAITAFNYFQNGDALPINTRVIVIKINTRWFIVAADCDS